MSNRVCHGTDGTSVESGDGLHLHVGCLRCHANQTGDEVALFVHNANWLIRARNRIGYQYLPVTNSSADRRSFSMEYRQPDLSCKVGGSLIGFVLFYWADRGDFHKTSKTPPRALLTILGHLTLLLPISRLVQKFFETEGTTPSIAKEATFSAAWCFYAAWMVACGFWFRYPLPLVLGLGLFATVLAKVFLLDLARFALIVRVVALVILGLL